MTEGLRVRVSPVSVCFLHINPSLVLVQTRKTGPITERLLMGHKESIQTNICFNVCFGCLNLLDWSRQENILSVTL